MLGHPAWPVPPCEGLAGAVWAGLEGVLGDGEGLAAKAATENPTTAATAASGAPSSINSLRFTGMSTSDV
jgi:hypothetical protein